MNRPPLDVPCTRCNAPVGKKCVTDARYGGGGHNARYDASTDKFLEAHGYEPLRGESA